MPKLDYNQTSSKHSGLGLREEVLSITLNKEWEPEKTCRISFSLILLCEGHYGKDFEQNIVMLRKCIVIMLDIKYHGLYHQIMLYNNM